MLPFFVSMLILLLPSSCFQILRLVKCKTTPLVYLLPLFYFHPSKRPWKIDEPDGLKTFRIGLFGLDKLGDIPNTLGTMEKALDAVLHDLGHPTKAPKAA